MSWGKDVGFRGWLSVVNFDIFDIFNEYIKKAEKILIRMNIYHFSVGTSVTPNSPKTGCSNDWWLNAYFWTLIYGDSYSEKKLFLQEFGSNQNEQLFFKYCI